MPRPIPDRRAFLRTFGTGLAGFLASAPALCAARAPRRKPLRIGFVADVHKDIMHDADERLGVFVEAMKKVQPDFVVQLGDFCFPIPENQAFLDLWNRIPCPRVHVLGNHDMDGDGTHRPAKAYGFTREETMAFWGMPARFHSFDVGGVHFIVLDGNDRGPGQKGYVRFIGPEQADWLTEDLRQTDKPTVLFIHQSLERRGGVENGSTIRAILEAAQLPSGEPKVVACFSGHHHRDYVRRLGGILYPQINSMSYHWLGRKYQHIRYGEDIDREHPSIKNTVPYRDPLYAIVTLDCDRGFLEIEGTRTEFVGPSPWELGASPEELDEATLQPAISDWRIPV